LKNFLKEKTETLEEAILLALEVSFRTGYYAGLSEEDLELSTQYFMKEVKSKIEENK
jgi:hypothetical protein